MERPIYHTFNPGVMAIELDFGQTNLTDTVTGSPSLNSHEAYVYVEDEIEFQIDSRQMWAFTVHHYLFKTLPTTHYNSLALNYRLPGGVAQTFIR